MPSAPMIWPVKIHHRHRNAAHFRIELAIVEGDAAALDLGDLAQQHRDAVIDFLVDGFISCAFKETLQLIGT
jgi:hypothetical protein